MERGTVLAGRYVVQELFRRDVCGATYLAQDSGSELLVAIQVIPEQIGDDERLLADLQRNFFLLHTLDHPHITKMHALEYDASQKCHFLVQEYAVGVSLLEYRLSRPGQRVSMEEAVVICRQVADALDHAHRSLLHRNIRSDTITLTPEGYVKLWNFGLIPEMVRRELRLSVGWEFGQPEARIQCYMAPEQLAGMPSQSPASDRWALAVVFYELISGQLPFDFADPNVLTHAICHEDPEEPVGIGRRYRWFGGNQVFARAFAKDPGERFPSAMAFINAMDFSSFPSSLQSVRKVARTALFIMLLAFSSWILFSIFPRILFGPSSPVQTQQQRSIPGEEKAELTPDLKKSLLLRIESRPPGATVVLDGKRLGITPFTVGRVAPGAYHLWLEKSEFKPVDLEIDLTQDTIVSMSLDALSPLQPMASAVRENEPIEEGADDTPDLFPVDEQKNERAIPAEEGMRFQETERSQPNIQDQATVEAVRHWLDGASEDLQASRLTRPKGANALEKYQAILRMEPQNSEAKKGLEVIINRLVVLAHADIKAGRLTKPLGLSASDKLQVVMDLNPYTPELDKSLKNLVVRYRALTSKDRTLPEKMQRLLDRQKNLEKPTDAQSHSEDKMLKFGKISTISQPQKIEQRTLHESITGMDFVWVDKGCFLMGSNQGDMDEVPAHTVCLDGFWMGRHEVTQEAWKRVMGDEKNPSKFQEGGNYPVDSVSWEAAQRFILRLNRRSQDHFRLPTEAEWEYGCRAGSQTPFHFGNSIHAGKANFNGERDFKEGPKGRFVGKTLPVGSFAANPFGLYDMHGNVYEWVEDFYNKEYYGRSLEKNPLALVPDKTAGTTGGVHVLRGGAWYSNPRNLRCAYRYRGPAGQHNHGYGFRLLREDSPLTVSSPGQ